MSIDVMNPYENSESMFKKGNLFEAIFGGKMKELLDKVSKFLGGDKSIENIVKTTDQNAESVSVGLVNNTDINRIESKPKEKEKVINIKTHIETMDPTYISEALKNFVKKHEGRTPVSKRDYAQYSRGYGTKAPAGGMKISQEQAEQELIRELKTAKGRVINRLQKKGVPNITQGQVDALVSLSYNAGPKRAYEMIDKMAAGLSTEEVVGIFRKKSITAGGKVLDGLVKRRKEEAEMFAIDTNQQTNTLANVA